MSSNRSRIETPEEEECRPGPAGQDEAARGGNVVAQRAQDVERITALEMVHVVEEQRQRLYAFSEPRDQAGKPQRYYARCAEFQPGEDVLIGRRGTPEGVGEVVQEHHGVVVALLEREPGERPPLLSGELPEQRRLAIARGRLDEDHASPGGGAESLQQPGSRHRVERSPRRPEPADERRGERVRRPTGRDGHPPMLRRCLATAAARWSARRHASPITGEDRTVAVGCPVQAHAVTLPRCPSRTTPPPFPARLQSRASRRKPSASCGSLARPSSS